MVVPSRNKLVIKSRKLIFLFYSIAKKTSSVLNVLLVESGLYKSSNGTATNIKLEVTGCTLYARHYDNKQ